MGHFQDDLYEAARERWIEQFIEDNDREPTDEEIDDAMNEAYIDYVSGMADAAYDRMRDGD